MNKYITYIVSLICELCNLIFFFSSAGKRNYGFGIETWKNHSNKVENILKGSLDSIPSPSPSVKIQIMGRKVDGIESRLSS